LFKNPYLAPALPQKEAAAVGADRDFQGGLDGGKVVAAEFFPLWEFIGV
jgi:hypothetical protein